jgi:GT2 family glycosyltransferase
VSRTTPNSDQADGAPAVSVIMPAYNVAPFIGAALESVFAQTFKNFEVIVVNDGSPDSEDLERALEPYLRRIHYLKQENRGVSAARNTALRAARGKLVAHLDPDDLWEPDYLSKQVTALENDPSTDVLFPDAVIFGDVPEAGRRLMDLCPSVGEITIEQLLNGRCHVVYSVTARREVLFRVGLFDEDLRCAEDFDLWLRLLKDGARIGYQRRVLMRYRRRAGSHTADSKWLRESVWRVLDKAERTLDLSPEELKALRDMRKRVQAEAALESGKQAFFRGDTDSALASIRTANAHFKSVRLALVTVFMRLMPRLLRRGYDLRDRYLAPARRALRTRFTNLRSETRI